jgi:uncharacterized membrane protein YfcA
VPLVADHWWLFPTATAISTLAMSSGVGGAILFSPLFMLVLELPPPVAIGTALLTQIFGVGSGAYAYRQRRCIDYRIAGRLLLTTVPGAVIGVLAAGVIDGETLRRLFAIGLIVIGIQFFRSYRQERRTSPPLPGADREIPVPGHASDLPHRHALYRPRLASLLGAGGGALLGSISVGLAELLEYHFIVLCRLPSAVAVGTSVAVLFVTTLVAATGHLYGFVTHAPPGTLTAVWQVVVFTIPGVMLGGQVGPWLQTRLDPLTVRLGMTTIFCALGLFMLGTT